MAISPDEAIGMTIGRLLDRAVEHHGDRLACVDGDQRVTYRDLAVEVDRCANGLIAHGVEHGDRVAVWMPNNIRWLVLYLACGRVGAVLVPINTALRAPEVKYQLEQSSARVVIAGGRIHDRSIFEAASAVVLECAHQPTLIAGCDEDNADRTFGATLALGDTVEDYELRRRSSEVFAETPLLILYTSGTTGPPKGAILAHTMTRNCADIANRLRLDSDDQLVLYLPLFHAFAITAVQSFLWVGGCLALMERFSARRSLELMERERATVAYGVNTMFYDQLNEASFPTRDLSALRFCLTNGRGELIEMLDEKMACAVNLYGMTETTGFTAIGSPSDDAETRRTTNGQPLPGADVCILGDDGAPLPRGSRGMIAVRGHMIFREYFERPQETAASFNERGWFVTGDSGHLTTDGQLCFAGRIGDMMKVGGENVHPAEIEDALMSHDAVRSAAVFGVQDLRLGEVPVAAVELHTNKAVGEDELRTFVASRLAKFKVPREVRVMEELPRTGSGKIQKYVLRDLAGADTAAGAPRG